MRVSLDIWPCCPSLIFASLSAASPRPQSVDSRDTETGLKDASSSQLSGCHGPDTVTRRSRRWSISSNCDTSLSFEYQCPVLGTFM